MYSVPSMMFRVTESKPCQKCIDTLRGLGIKKIGYSDINGDIVVNKIENMTGILSGAQMSFDSKFNKMYTGLIQNVI